jgi:hypothetical protein
MAICSKKNETSTDAYVSITKSNPLSVATLQLEFVFQNRSHTLGLDYLRMIEIVLESQS